MKTYILHINIIKRYESILNKCIRNKSFMGSFKYEDSLIKIKKFPEEAWCENY